jgi:outer membrane murein-binding lipoprotein Lpp
MAREMEAEYASLLQAHSAKAESIPHELQELDARLARLRARLQAGDLDLTADELQAAIARVEAKRDELRSMQPAARKSARIVSMLPKMAALYRKQNADGLDGDERAMAKAHLFLRDLLGPISLTPGKKGEL